MIQVTASVVRCGRFGGVSQRLFHHAEHSVSVSKVVEGEGGGSQWADPLYPET